MSRPSARSGLLSAILAGLGLRRGGAEPAPEGPSPAELAGHEVSDVDVRNTGLVMAGLGGSALTAVGIMVWLMHAFAGAQRNAEPPLTPQQVAKIRPPPPNLQADPYLDIDRARAEAARALDGYAYLDAGRSRARIPIARAMALTAGRPLDP